MSSMVRLRILPRVKCLFDEPIQVKVAGLRSKQLVTLKATATDDKAVVFTSSATYRADDSGEVDLQRHPSLKGNYTGVEPMGLLWSMKANLPHRYLDSRTALSTHSVTFSVHEEGEEGEKLAEATNERIYIADGVTRVPVKEGNIPNVKGVLFTPPGEGPFPAILDVSSFICETRASLLASKGYVVLSVSVFIEKPGKNPKLDLDPLEEAMNFLRKQPKVGSKGVGLVGLSKAADIVLSMASFLPDIDAAIWINGCSANVGVPLYYKQKQILPGLTFDHSKLVYTESGAWMMKDTINDHLAEENQDTVIPIEKAKARFLFAVSEDDLSWDSRAYVDHMVQRLESHGKKNYEVVGYHGSSHVLEPPYGPYCPSSLHVAFGKPVLWGGNAKDHAAAEVHLWKKIQQFFKTHLI